jgi:hypothetical protein
MNPARADDKRGSESGCAQIRVFFCMLAIIANAVVIFTAAPSWSDVAALTRH